jgi:hypothetical protein
MRPRVGTAMRGRSRQSGRVGVSSIVRACAGGEDDDVPATLSESASYEWYYCVVVLADS